MSASAMRSVPVLVPIRVPAEVTDQQVLDVINYILTGGDRPRAAHLMVTFQVSDAMVMRSLESLLATLVDAVRGELDNPEQSPAATPVDENNVGI